MDTIEQKQITPTETLPKSELEIFKDKIKEIKEAEMNKRKAWEDRGMEGKAYNPHFDAINQDYLEEPEREVYEKYQDDNLSTDEFRELRSAANKNYKKLPVDAKKETLSNFWAYIGNLVTAREGRRQLEEIKRRNSQKIIS